uniref:Copper transport protein n=1 Tax=Elaeophora elaphi TaxID=1147741 RepID=A0A0R3RNX4_9BILA
MRSREDRGCGHGFISLSTIFYYFSHGKLILHGVSKPEKLLKTNILLLSEMIISCVGIYLLGIFFGVIKLVRKKFNSTFSKLSITADNATFMKTAYHQMFQVALFVIQLIINYLLMLIFMSYSVWFGIAVVLGITTGSWVFA